MLQAEFSRLSLFSREFVSRCTWEHPAVSCAVYATLVLSFTICFLMIRQKNSIQWLMEFWCFLSHSVIKLYLILLWSFRCLEPKVKCEMSHFSRFSVTTANNLTWDLFFCYKNRIYFLVWVFLDEYIFQLKGQQWTTWRLNASKIKGHNQFLYNVMESTY